MPGQTKPTGSTPIINRRLRAALILRGVELEGLARRAEISSRHLSRCMAGERPLSERAQQVLQDAVGEEGWAFATGQSAVLKDAL